MATVAAPTEMAAALMATVGQPAEAADPPAAAPQTLAETQAEAPVAPVAVRPAARAAARRVAAAQAVAVQEVAPAVEALAAAPAAANNCRARHPSPPSHLGEPRLIGSANLFPGDLKTLSPGKFFSAPAEPAPPPDPQSQLSPLADQ